MTRKEYQRQEFMFAALGKIGIPRPEAETLRRASMTLHRWAEQECGDSNEYASWCIERDEKTGKPFRRMVPHNTPAVSRRTPIPDRETGALNRIKAICSAKGVHYFHQTDCRGAALYVHYSPMMDSNYSNGIAVY